MGAFGMCDYSVYQAPRPAKKFVPLPAPKSKRARNPFAEPWKVTWRDRTSGEPDRVQCRDWAAAVEFVAKLQARELLNGDVYAIRVHEREVGSVWAGPWCDVTSNLERLGRTHT